MVQKTGSLDYDGETFSFILMEDQMMQTRAAMGNMQTRLVQAETALVEARATATPTPKMASLVDTWSIDKALSSSGDHKEWRYWTFQLPSYTGSANARAIEALKSAATCERAITNEDLHLMVTSRSRCLRSFTLG